MATDFVPLAPARHGAAPDTSFRVRVRPVDPAAEAFVPRQPQPVRSAAAPADHAGHEPKISTQKDGDRVTGVRIECGCGQVIDLTFVY